jgi:hypothetical protein
LLAQQAGHVADDIVIVLFLANASNWEHENDVIPEKLASLTGAGL